MALARPLVLMNRLTDKLNPVVRPLMESIKRETDSQLQVCTAAHARRRWWWGGRGTLNPISGGGLYEPPPPPVFRG